MHWIKQQSAANFLATIPMVERGSVRTHDSYCDSRRFRLEPHAAVGVPGIASVRATLHLRRGRGHFLHISDGVTHGTKNQNAVLEAARQAIVDGRWCLRWLLVGERLKVNDGFAVYCKGRGAHFTVRVDGPMLPVHPTVVVLKNLGMQFESGATNTNHWQFSPGSVVTFDRVYRVYPSLVRKLYGDWRGDPQNVYYRENQSNITPVMLRNMQLDSIFETGFSISSLK